MLQVLIQTGELIPGLDTLSTTNSKNEIVRGSLSSDGIVSCVTSTSAEAFSSVAAFVKA